MKKQIIQLATVALTSTLVLAACGGNKSNDGAKRRCQRQQSVAIVTDVGGVMTVHLTNQLGKDYKLGVKAAEKGVGGYNYFQSDKESACYNLLCCTKWLQDNLRYWFQTTTQIEKAAIETKITTLVSLTRHRR